MEVGNSSRSPSAKAVTAAAHDALPGTLDLLADLIGSNSHADNAAGLQVCRYRLRTPLERLGFSVEDVRSTTHGDQGTTVRTHLRATRKGPRDSPKILLLGHLDVVFTPEQHFELERDGDRWRGPGASDMKGGIATAMMTLELLARFEQLDRASWMVLLVSDEEIGSPTATPLLEAAGAWADIALCFEAARPCGSLVAGRKGVLDAKIVVEGRTGHAGIDYDRSTNALTVLARFLTRAVELSGQGVTVSPGGRVSVYPDSVNTIPERAVCELEWRYPDRASGDRVRASLRAIAEELSVGEARIEMILGHETPPMPASGRSEPLIEHYRQAARAVGLEIGAIETAGAGDINIVAGGGAICLDGVGPEGGGFHTRSEHVRVDTIPVRAAMSVLALSEALGVDLVQARRVG